MQKLKAELLLLISVARGVGDPKEKAKGCEK